MDDSPLDELLKRLEDSLVNLLQSVRGDPWSLLIFQTLIWSFRRWAVYYLVSEDMDTNMHDYLWDSHIDLVKEHAPDGLKEFGVVWLSPTNVGDRVDYLEELNSYFLFIVDKLNHAIDTDNQDEQNLLAIFLDETITDIIAEWLEGRTEFRIYPDHDESSEKFSSEKIFSIMQIILEKNARPREEISLPPSTTAPTKLEVLNEPTMYTVAPLEAPAPIPVPIPVPVEAPAPIPVPVPVPVSPVTNPLHITIANALKRRKTLRLHGRRAESNVPNRSSTKKRRFVQQP
jgi:hypothetical protein